MDSRSELFIGGVSLQTGCQKQQLCALPAHLKVLGLGTLFPSKGLGSWHQWLSNFSKVICSSREGLLHPGSLALDLCHWLL